MSVRRRVSLILLFLLVPITGFAIWQAYQQLPARPNVPPPIRHDAEKWKFANEEHWLADETVRDIAEMLAFAKDANAGLELTVTPKAANSYELQAQFGGTTVGQALTLHESIWSPSDYAGWAGQILAQAKLKATESADTPTAWIKSMTQPTPQNLMQEGGRLTKALTAEPLNASLHEQAALVITSFAMREAANAFSDYRRELCRATAHLSIARALQPEARGPIRDLAEACLATLAERNGPALATLEKLNGNADLKPWVNALRIRNTGDWRNQQSGLTLLEQIEVFRARTANIDAKFALAWLQTQKGAATVPDWQRIALESNFGVEVGHEIATNCIPQEIGILGRDWNSYFGSSLAEADVVKAMNEPAGRSVMKGKDGKPELRVLGWDFWAAQHQRELCQCIRATNNFLRDGWGVPEYKNVQKFVKEHYSGITRFPLLERELSNEETDFNAVHTRVTALVFDHPELVNAALWNYLNKSPNKKSPSLHLPDTAHWVTDYCPFGTAYEYGKRCYELCVPEANEPEKWKALLALAPRQYDVLYGHVWKRYHDQPPIEVAEAEMAPITPYSMRALIYLRNIEFNRSPKYPETVLRICAFDPDSYITLGNYYVMHAQPKQAAEAFQKAVDKAPDRIAVANGCSWYVNYLDDQGRKAEATALAQEAAEVYSYRGLETMARLMEKRGQLKDAENYFQKIAERYEDKSQVQAFYVRNASDPMFAAVGGPMRTQIYPHGIEKVALADLKAPPSDGLKLVTTNTFATSIGLAAGDVFVGFDGIRVHNLAQFGNVRLSSANPVVSYVVWNSHGYHEVKTILPARLLGVKIDNWQAK